MRLQFRGVELDIRIEDWRITIADLVRKFSKELGLPLRAAPMRNGVRVKETCDRLQNGDVISFVELGPCEC